MNMPSSHFLLEFLVVVSSLKLIFFKNVLLLFQSYLCPWDFHDIHKHPSGVVFYWV